MMNREENRAKTVPRALMAVVGGRR